MGIKFSILRQFGYKKATLKPINLQYLYNFEMTRQ